MSEDRVLPIDRAPHARQLAPLDLGALNESLLKAQLAESTMRELAARLELARRDAAYAAECFRRIRDGFSSSLGVKLGETHGWDSVTGEIRPVQQQ